MHCHNGFALRLQRFQNRDDGFFRCGIDPCKRFIQKVDIGPLRQGAGEENALLLTTRKLPDLAICKTLHSDTFQSLGRNLPVPRPHQFKKAQFAIKPHQHHIKNGCRKIPIHTGPLGHIGDAVAFHLKRAAINGCLPRERVDHAKHRFEQG